MAWYDYFTKRGRQLINLRKQYSELDNGQLSVALNEMYERLMFIGTNIKNNGKVSPDLTAGKAVDEFDTMVDALLSVVQNRLGGAKLSPAQAPTSLSFQGANPKLAKDEAKLISYGMAFKVPEMDKFAKWRNGEDYQEGGVTWTPFSQHTNRYMTKFEATADDLTGTQGISKPADIKRNVMSEENVEAHRRQMENWEYLGGGFINVKGLTREIAKKLPGQIQQILRNSEKEGFKIEDVVSWVAEFAQSKEMAEMDNYKGTSGEESYHKRCDIFNEKYPVLAKTLGIYDASILVQVAQTMHQNKAYIPAITEFLKKPENLDDFHYDKENGKSAEILAEYIRNQERGTLYKQETQQVGNSTPSKADILRKQYAELDNGQLSIAIAEMHERLVCVGTNPIPEYLSANAKDTSVIDNLSDHVDALLSVAKERVGDKAPAAKAKALDFTGANPKVADMEARLLGYGMALCDPASSEMPKYAKWRDGEDYKQGSLSWGPFSSHSSRYYNKEPLSLDLFMNGIREPEEIKRTVMSEKDVAAAKAEKDTVWEHADNHLTSIDAEPIRAKEPPRDYSFKDKEPARNYVASFKHGNETYYIPKQTASTREPARAKEPARNYVASFKHGNETYYIPGPKQQTTSGKMSTKHAPRGR